MGKANFSDEFKRDAVAQIGVRAMCRCLAVQPSGFYAWQKSPLSQRAREDARQTDLIRKAWNDSGKVYGYRKLHDDLLDHGETCCPNRVARLTRLAGIRAQIGYKRRPGSYGGKPSLVIDNTLDRQDVFDYVEMFYNPVRKQVRNGMLSPVEFERQQILKVEGV